MNMYKFVGVLLAAVAQPAFAFNVTVFSPSAFNSDVAVMNGTLGIDAGFIVENFEDTTLVPGMSISFENGVPLQTISTLPDVFSNDGLSTWDGVSSLISTPSQTCPFFPGGCGGAEFANTVTFNINGGTSAFGVGLISFQSTSPAADVPITNHKLIINGVEVAQDLEQLLGVNFTPSAFNRNAYILLTPDITEGAIFSVGFRNSAGTDLLSFDHVAIAAVPVPPSIWLLAPVLFGVGVLRRRSS